MTQPDKSDSPEGGRSDSSRTGVERQLMECEEALRCAEAEAAKWRTMIAEPVERTTGRSVNSLPWDDLLGIASRNSSLALDAVEIIEAIAHHDEGRAGEIAHEWLVRQRIWAERTPEIRGAFSAKLPERPS